MTVYGIGDMQKSLPPRRGKVRMGVKTPEYSPETTLLHIPHGIGQGSDYFAGIVE